MTRYLKVFGAITAGLLVFYAVIIPLIGALVLWDIWPLEAAWSVDNAHVVLRAALLGGLITAALWALDQ